MRRAIVPLLLIVIFPSTAVIASPEVDGEDDLLLRVGIVGDAQESGERLPFRSALAQLDALNASLVLYGGDTNYVWEAPPPDWVDALGPYRDRLWFVVGNHDDGPAYAEWLPDGATKTWWSAPLTDDVVVVALDTERPLYAETEQRAWLEQELHANRERTVILVMHIPWWAGNFHHKKALDFPGSAEDMDALVAEYDVDLVLAAHEHYYLRKTRGETPYVINSAVDARTRTVPPDLAENATLRSPLNRTWMRMDVLPCGLALWTTLHEPGGGILDSFAVEDAPGSVLLDGDVARCVPRQPTSLPPAEPQSPAPGPAGPADPIAAVPGIPPALAATLAAGCVFLRKRRPKNA